MTCTVPRSETNQSSQHMNSTLSSTLCSPRSVRTEGTLSGTDDIIRFGDHEEYNPKNILVCNEIKHICLHL